MKRAPKESQKETRLGCLGIARTGGDPWEMQERISKNLDNSRKHAYGHKKRR